MKYKILTTPLRLEEDTIKGIAWMEEAVKREIAKGWVPQGGIQFLAQSWPRENCLMQAMILREENDK